MNERSKQLGSAVDALLAIHAEWEESDQPMTDEFAAAVDDTLAVFADGDLPGDCRELANVVLAMEATWETYKDQAALQDDPMYLPPGEFWKRLGKLRELRSRRTTTKRYTLEKISDLVAQKVSPAQICRIYGFVDDEGREELWRLEEEQQTPGLHTGPESGWMPPQQRRDMERQNRANDAMERLNKRIAARAKQAERKLAPPKESLRELVLGGTSAEQIALMMRITVDEVYDRCEKEGLKAPPLNYAESLAEAEIKPQSEERLATLTQGRNRTEAEQPVDLDTDAGDAEIDALIAELIDEGATDRAIKERVQEQYGKGINVRRIERLRATLQEASQ